MLLLDDLATADSSLVLIGATGRVSSAYRPPGLLVPLNTPKCPSVALLVILLKIKGSTG